MRALEDQPPEGPHRPSVEFWEHRLELPARRILEDAADPAFMKRWIERRRPWQVAMLRRLLGLQVDVPVRGRKAELQDHQDELVRFLPAAEFASRKSMHAAVDVAIGCLDQADIETAHEGDGRYDTTALAFAILERSWPDLEKVLHLDKLHSVDFARMRLRRPPRRPGRSFADFLETGAVPAILRRYDADKGGRHTSEFQHVIDVRDSQVVFIRRPHQPRYVLAGNQVVHGFSPDPIVLDFRNEAALLNVASHGHEASYEIANRIATAFYGQPCEYENVTEEAFAAQITRFVEALRNDQARDLRLVEIRVKSSPLDNSPDLQLSNPDNLSVGPAIAQLEQALSWTVGDLDRIPRFKVLFNEKRVLMVVEPLEGEPAEERKYVLRYGDQPLSLVERQAFEELIENEHGLRVVSTEKRGARRRQD
jgi:hypothetical protein